MKTKVIKIFWVICILLGLILPAIPINQNQGQIIADENKEIANTIEPLSEVSEVPFFDGPKFLEKPIVPGRTEGIGSYFKIEDSEYLNVALKSSEEIKIVLESIPRMISLDIEAASPVNSINLTIEGLEPNKTYYKYQDSYKNGAVFVSDDNGIYTWTQDLTQLHHIWIQETKGTIFLPEDCPTYGTWDEITSTCTLNQDLIESVEITQNNVILDCAGYNIAGSQTGYGIYLNNKSGAIIKNCTIKWFTSSIYLYRSNNNILDGNTISSNRSNGIQLWGSDNNTMNSNIISSNITYGIDLYYSDNNILTKNSVSDSIVNICIEGSWTNKIIRNNISGNFWYGIYIRPLWGSSSAYNSIAENTITRDTVRSDAYGVCIFGGYLPSRDNIIYHNNFIRTGANVYGGALRNLFDDGYPSGGNYWSDYTGVDLSSGQNQDQPGSDGIGDIPRAFSGGQDNYPFITENGWEVPPESEKWSFAIITDLHIGRGYPDYGGEGWDDSGTMGQDYYLTKRIETAVEEIKKLKDEHNIKFVAVLGDITDSGEYSEFVKAKEVLNKLNYDSNGDGILDMVYVPIIGNHDVWPIIRTVDPKGGNIKETKAEHSSTYFYEVFSEQFDMLRNYFPDWQGPDGTIHMNYTFTLDGMKFICADFANRAGPSPEAILHGETKNWFNNYLQERESTIILSHHPLIGDATLEGVIPQDLLKDFIAEIEAFESENINELAELIQNSEAKVLANFAGHVHGFYDEFFPPYIPKDLRFLPVFWEANRTYKEPALGDIPIITSEASMVGSNRLIPKGIIRIVEIKDNNISDYSLIKGEEKFRALNPYFKEIEWSPRVEIEWGFPPKANAIWEVEFELYAFTELYSIDYTLKFGDGSDESDQIPERLYPPIEVEHNYPKEGGTYSVEWVTKKTTPFVEENITRTTTLPRWKWGFFNLSPVDIVLTDPDGFTINKETSEIPGAFYFETDLNKDGETDDIIILPERKIGDYSVKVIPESTVDPVDTYTLGVLTEDDNIIFLAENIEINNIPSLPYIVKSTETETLPIIPATADFDPGTLNLKSKGKVVTAYIELPVGHGYDVSQVDLENVILNGQIRAEVKPTKTGDYDSDGILDLMVKFNRSDVQNTLSVGEKIKITITGNLVDGRLFEGADFIRVISL